METDAPEPLLPHVPEDWNRALAVVAHPDDLEYGAASAIARWTAQGKHISYCLVTSGEAGIDSLAPDACARLRQGEQRSSAAVVGVEIRRDLAAAIRRHRPDVLISISHRELVGGGLNHADHRAVGTALLDAVRDASNRWIFPGVGGDPHSDIRFAIFNSSPNVTHGVDITDTIEAGVASLEAHGQYLAALAEGTPGKEPGPFLRGIAEACGPRLGVSAATLFELIQVG